MTTSAQTTSRTTAFRIGDWLVEPALNRISRDSEDVAIENKSMDVLVLLADRAGEVVSADEIIVSVWGDQPLGDNPVYKCIASLRKALGDTAKAPQYIETIARRGYRLVAETGPVETDARHKRARLSVRQWPVIASMALAAAVLFIAFLVQPSARNVDSEHSIAVLPFDNLTDNPDKDLFCRGVADDVLNALAEIVDLRVVARQSAFSAATASDGYPAIARRLGVDFLVSGNVRSDDDGLRITARLLNADGDVIWSHVYHRLSEQMLDVQWQIANQVAHTLSLTPALTSHGHNLPTASLDAWTAYQLGSEKLRRRSENWLDEAVQAFEEATRIDPEFAAPYAGNAIAQIIKRTTGVADRERALALINTALELNPNLAEGHAALGLWHMQELPRPDFETAVLHLRRALKLNPALVQARVWLATALKMLGNIEEATRVLETTVAIDPLNPLPNLNLGRQYQSQGRLDAARAQFVRVLDFPDAPAYTWWWLSDLERRVGDYDAALGWLKQAFSSGAWDASGSNWESGVVASVYADLGMTEQARHWLSLLTNDVEPLWRLSFANDTLAVLGDDEALAEYAAALEASAGTDVFSAIWPQMILGLMAIRQQNYELGIDLLAPWFDDGVPFYNGPGGEAEIIDTIHYFAVALTETGDASRAVDLLRQAEQLQQRLRTGVGRLSGLLLAREAVTFSLLGQHVLAHERLQEAYDAGWREYHRARNHPGFRTLFSQPESAAILARARDEVALQREKINAQESLQPFLPLKVND